MAKSLYETDFYTWARQQAEAIRSGRVHLIDVENVAEEIETLGRSEASALKSSYRLIAMHLLTMMHQPDARTVSRVTTVQIERLNAAESLDDNPGLKSRRQDLFDRAYALARKEAAIETGVPLGQFPKDPPFTVEDIESDDFWPGRVST